MTDLTLNIGGLIAYVLNTSRKECDAVLLAAASHASSHGAAHDGSHPSASIPPHLPVLLVPKAHVASAPERLPQIYLKGRVDPRWALPANLDDCYAWQLGRCNISVVGANEQSLVYNAPGQTTLGEVPANNDWSDLKWLLSMKRILPNMALDRDACLASMVVSAVLHMTEGSIAARVPIDDVPNNRRLYRVGPLRQAVTDSIVYRFSNDPLALRILGNYSGELVFKPGVATAYLLNLPDKMFQGTPLEFGDHFAAYYSLPFSPPAPFDVGPWPGVGGVMPVGGSQCMSPLIEI